MKKLFTLIYLALFCTSIFALDIFNYVPVSGNVKSIIQTDYEITTKFGNYFRTPSAKVVHILNESGKEIETTELTPKDVVLDKTVTKYDVYGNVIEQATYDSESILLWRTVITYKGTQKVDSSEYGKNGVLKAKTIFIYDEFGNLIDETGYDGEGELIWKIKYQYKGAKLETVSEYYSDGSLSREEKYTYNASGNIESIVTYDVFSSTTEIIVFRYAANGQITEITTYGNEKQMIKRLMLKYDATGNVAKLSDYAVAEKFGTTVNELTVITEYMYQ